MYFSNTMIQKTFMASILLPLVLLMLVPKITGAQSVGVCYGRNGKNLPAEGEVIELYKKNEIGRMRIYETNDAIYQALKGSNIELTITILNDNLQALTNAAAATDWVKKNVQAYWPDVKVKYIAVGNEVHPDHVEAQYLLPAIQNIHKAIVAAKLQGQIKVSTAIDTTLVDSASAFPPSNGVYSSVAKPFITPIINFLVSNGAPLLLNVYPYFSYIGDSTKIDLSYALFTSQGVMVNGTRYPSLFDALLDAQYSALEKADAKKLEIVVSESGWPSEGGKAATAENARTFYRHLISHVTNTTGTPKRPGKAIETYLFAMFDENKKNGNETEKHFGVFFPDKRPKYEQLTFG